MKAKDCILLIMTIFFSLKGSAAPAVDTTQLCPGQNTIIVSNKTGNTYQWQVNSGSGYVNVTNNAIYGGANTVELQINNPPTSLNGYLYRCIVDGAASNISTLQFVNNWIGIDPIWENAYNWRCGVLPDANTDVIIYGGFAILNSNAACRSINLGPGASFRIEDGKKLTITH